MVLCAVHLLWNVLLDVRVVDDKRLWVDMKLIPKYVKVPQKGDFVFEKPSKPFIIRRQTMFEGHNVGLKLCVACV